MTDQQRAERLGYTVTAEGRDWVMRAPDATRMTCLSKATAWEGAKAHSRWEGLYSDDLTCRACEGAYGAYSDGWDGLCPTCADVAEQGRTG